MILLKLLIFFNREQQSKRYLKDIYNIKEVKQERRRSSSPRSSYQSSSEKSHDNNRIKAFLLTTLPLDLLFLGILVVLLMVFCPNWDRFSLCNSASSLSLTSTRRWPGLPPMWCRNFRTECWELLFYHSFIDLFEERWVFISQATCPIRLCGTLLFNFPISNVFFFWAHLIQMPCSILKRSLFDFSFFWILQ